MLLCRAIHYASHRVATSSCRGHVDELATEPFLLLHREHRTGYRSTDSFRRDLKAFLFHSVYGRQDTDWLCDAPSVLGARYKCLSYSYSCSMLTRMAQIMTTKRLETCNPASTGLLMNSVLVSQAKNHVSLTRFIGFIGHHNKKLLAM